MTTTTSPQQQYPMYHTTALTRSILAGNVLPISTDSVSNQSYYPITIATTEANDIAATTEKTAGYDSVVRIAAALVPTKAINGRRSNKGRKRYYPRLNNFFPVIFSFPRLTGGRRRGSSSSSSQVPRLVAAIANSYSTTNGGMASSVATAYGLPAQKTKRKTLVNRIKAGTAH
ncbi:hypothetical protein QAD02_022565 [Eretmocerus hayati]|uniref:Uncharacterized protein n=1 Tax=Eretmocerus hayati TaxID=131215 RepID=A0ACC2PVF6_9HYME|nr:hypothetical protein QAD02_022565 [Eretmocerus hayati]